MPPAMSILVIDDDISLCELLSDTFEEYGYQVSCVQSGQAALALLSTGQQFQLIFLDLILPDINGLVLLQQLKNLVNTPIIMLSGLNAESDVVVGLEMGADDYIAKPFYPRVVVARAKVAIRRGQPQSCPSPQQQGLRFQQWFLDTDKHKLYSPQRQEIELTQGEYLLLFTLLSHAQKALSRQQLLELTHSENLEIFDRTIDVLIMRLRKKIEPNPKAPTFIQTVRGIGYMFNFSVEKSE